MMFNAWWFVLELFITLILLVWTNRMSYKYGIWEGAFNHFLPVVKKEMMYYDEHRAKQILDGEE